MVSTQSLADTCTGVYLHDMWGTNERKMENQLKSIIKRRVFAKNAHIITTTQETQKVANKLLRKYGFRPMPWSESGKYPYPGRRTRVWVLRLCHMSDEVKALLK